MTRADGRPRLLVLAQCLPYPPISGVRSRTFNVLRELQRGFDVTVLPFSCANHQPHAQDRANAREMLQRMLTAVGEPIPIPSEEHLARRLWDHARSVLTGRSYTYFEYRSSAFSEQLTAILRRQQPDLVHLDSIDLHGFLADLPRVPVACTHHDIEPQLLRIRATRTRAPFVGAYLRYQADLVEHLMAAVCPTLGLNVMMSRVDAARLRAIAASAKLHVAPNGVDTEYFRPMPEIEEVPGRVVFVGPMYQFANWDALAYLVEDVWPRVRARRRDASLVLVGDGSSADRGRFGGVSGVTAVGHVADVRPFLAQASCVAAPLRVGGGTRLKILDAWAMGKAVVSTTIGCEGLDAVDGTNLMIRDTAADLAEAILSLLGDRDLRRRIGPSGRDTVELEYSWVLIGENLCRAYRELI